ncbi:MAG: hypothetical protein QXK67_03165 [Pyrobaculum sp.]
MSLKIVIVKDHEEIHDGDVVIDAREPFQFFDVVILGGREIKSIIAVGQTSGGVPVGIGKYTKKVVASIINGRIYIRGVPLALYKEMGLLEKELSAIKKKRDEFDILIEKLKQIVIAERKKYRRSPSLSALNNYVEGLSTSLPSHLADIVEGVDRETLKKILTRLFEEVY